MFERIYEYTKTQIDSYEKKKKASVLKVDFLELRLFPGMTNLGWKYD